MAVRATRRSFGDETLDALDRAAIVGVRAGREHRYTGVWVVMVERRVFVRSWSDAPRGWYRAFREEPEGSLQLGAVEIPVRARQTRSQRLQETVTRAYARKYVTPASQKWVRGFAAPSRQSKTLELMPR